MTTTKQQRADAIVARLAKLFGTSVPIVRVGFGVTPRAIGTYWAAQPERRLRTNVTDPACYRICPASPAALAIRARASLETLAHEFAHHVEAERGVPHRDPVPTFLGEVRIALGGQPHCQLGDIAI